MNAFPPPLPGTTGVSDSFTAPFPPPAFFFRGDGVPYYAGFSASISYQLQHFTNAVVAGFIHDSKQAAPPRS